VSGIVEFLDNPIAEAHHAGVAGPDDPSGCEGNFKIPLL
jgi:hypothetical protein